MTNVLLVSILLVLLFGAQAFIEGAASLIVLAIVGVLAVALIGAAIFVVASHPLEVVGFLIALAGAFVVAWAWLWMEEWLGATTWHMIAMSSFVAVFAILIAWSELVKNGYL